MIRALWSSAPSFKRIEFRAGFNVITAEMTNRSSQKDSRNGLGKTSTLTLIRYLLGSTSLPPIKGTPLEEWLFFLSIDVGDKPFTVSRNAAQSDRVYINSGNVQPLADLGINIKSDNGIRYIDRKSWVRFLGIEFFKLPVAPGKDTPSFLSLNSYFMRADRSAYNTPFSYQPKRSEWANQIDNAYLIGLDWSIISTLNEFRKRQKTLNDVLSLSQMGVIKDYFGVRASLETERGRYVRLLEALRSEIAEFRMASQYVSIEENADELTTQINALANDNYLARMLVTDYRQSLDVENQNPYLNVEEIYERAGVMFLPETLREIHQVRAFHKQLVRNRRLFLEAEITQITSAIAAREQQISTMDSKRGEILKALESNRALDHYSLIRSRIEEEEAKLNAVDARLGALNDVEREKSRMRIELEMHKAELQKYFSESRDAIDNAARLFNNATLCLYNTPGDLVIVPSETGYKFSYVIDGKGSDGIGNAAIFCYDLTLIQIWSQKSACKTLFHDSTLFDPIDARQRAHALQLAAELSESEGFQYICCLSTDKIPFEYFTDGFLIEPFVVLRLTDATEDGKLFGLTF